MSKEAAFGLQTQKRPLTDFNIYVDDTKRLRWEGLEQPQLAVPLTSSQLLLSRGDKSGLGDGKKSLGQKSHPLRAQEVLGGL